MAPVGPHLRAVPPPPETVLFLRCRFRGIAGERQYAVDLNESERIESVLQSDKAVLAFDTLDGRAVYLNLQHLQVAYMNDGAFRPVPVAPDALIVQLVDAPEAIEVSTVDVDWTPNISMDLEEFGNLPERFVLFPDDLGGTWAINMGEIVFLEFPSRWHDAAIDVWEEQKEEIKRIAVSVGKERKAAKRKGRRTK